MSVNKMAPHHTVTIDGTSINFPFKPYDLQVDYMRKVLECVRESRNGLLESPTGTGKTLSLLCSSLAWLEQAKAAAQLARIKAATGGGPDPNSGEWSLGGGRHKIIFSSRTHSQLSQAMAELAGTTYRYMKVAILGSRDQLCVNPAVMQANNSREKLNMCQARVKSKTCVFHQNVEKHKDRTELRDNQLMDIEDLHKLGKKHNFCPYYMSRELYQTADVIFMPYNYLLDHKTRKTLDLDLNGAVIIFDEAHNIQKLCEETASGSMTLADIALAIKDIDDIVQELAEPAVGFDEKNESSGTKDINETEIIGIKALLLDVEARLGEMMGKARSGSLTLPGSFIMELFGPLRSGNHFHNIDLMVNYRSGTADAAISTKGRGLTKLQDLLLVAFNENIKQEDLHSFFKVHLSKEDKSEGGKGFLKSRSEVVTLNLWCFSPGFSMQRFSKLGTRSIILTSGTLSPLAAFQEEIGIPFPVQLENKHIISASQVWCGVVSQGPDGTVLNSSFKCRSDPKYLSSLGQSVINIIRLVPHGVLIFFPSYSLLNSTREFWQNGGIWSRIEAIKAIFIEPQKKEALSMVMRDYYAAVKEGRGACFLAVCRGKVAEGLDFADDNGRAVLITGLPYPPLKDPRVELKRGFLDEELRKKGRSGGQLSMNGNKWYSLEAFRATNQAIGRVIRHSRDHGAIIFLDTRFGEPSARQALSRWLQPFFQQHTQIGTAIKGIAGFFKTDSSLGKQRQEAIRIQNELINASKGVKRPRPEIKLEEDDVSASKAAGDAFLSADVYSQPATGCQSKVSSSIFSSSSSRICFNSEDLSSEHHRQSTVGHGSGAPPARKKLKIVVKGFPTSAGMEPDENSPDNRQQATVALAAAKSGTATPSEAEGGAQEKAKSYVGLLKKCLTADEFVMFKQAIQYYKAAADFQALRPVLEAVLVKYQVQQGSILTGFRVFIKKHHLAEFEAFCEKEAPS